jgi:hypothetical protein
MFRDPFSSKLTLALLLVPAAMLAPAPTLRAETPDEDLYLGESPERYAQVKIVEGDVRIQKGEGEEALTRGTPIAEGDVVESRGRGVLQLGDGTRIAFGPGTRFQVAALFADKKGERQVLLRLDYGRIRIALGAQSGARIRVDTLSGTATLADKASATCEVERDRTVRLRVHSGRISFANDAHQNILAAGERLTVYGSQDRLDRVRSFNTCESDDFDGWCEDSFAIRRRASWDRVPREIRYYADDLDDNGEWIYVDETSSWCWRPTGVSAEWRPYWHGRWGAYAGGMTWVSDEPWGYVTYHHGRWGWGTSFGWYWIPGVHYSPAWVAWNTFDSYFGWAPLGYWNAPCTWGYGAWGGGHCWNVVNMGHIGRSHLHTHTHSDMNIIRTFNHTTGGGPRPLTPPWQRGPLVVTRNEINNPAQFQRVVVQRPLLRERVQTYDRLAQTTTGRSILRRDLVQPGTGTHGTAATPAGPGRDGTGASSGFRRAEERRSVNSRPLIRENARPVQSAEPGRRESQPDRGREPRAADPGRATSLRDRAQEYRTRDPERPAPRETTRERSREFERPASREIPRETREAPAPREPSRSEPSREFRQERPSAPAPSPSSSPAPRPSTPDRPSSDRPRGR